MRAWLGLLTLAVCAALVAGGASQRAHRPAHAQGAGFFSETLVQGLSLPTDFAFAPDGRIFIAEKNGAVRVFKDGQLLADPFIELTVNRYADRGLLGLALDPDFTTNGYVYLYYVVENNPSSPAGPKTAQLLRVTADGDTALPGSESVVLGSVTGDPTQPSCYDFPLNTDCIPADGPSHNGGGLRFAPDGTLFLAIGDGEQFSPAQDIDTLAGVIVRINPDGSAPADNPFFTGDPQAVRSKVWAYGLRNPFRFGIQPGTGLPFVGDVGGSSWEEINIAAPGANLGWPCYEGEKGPTGIPGCPSLPRDDVTWPLYSYATEGGATVIGGVFYQGTNYPPEYQDAFFFGDYVRDTITVLRVDANNQLVPDSVEEVLDTADGPVDFELGPDGYIYYLSINTGEVRRLRFAGSERPPVAIASASPTSGQPPLTVQFTGSASYDPDGQPLSFFWDFDDGTTSTEADPVHTFTQEDTYLVRLTVTDLEGLSDTTSVLIQATNLPPEVTITEPADGTIYLPGDTIVFAGSAVDPEDGPLTGASLVWAVTLYHCYPQFATCHTHPFWDATGSGGSFVTSDEHAAGDVLFYEIALTATDSLGASSTASVLISPDSDGDGLSDQLELLSLGTDPFDTDSDDDGELDGQEDTDGDGCANLAEIGGDPTSGGLRDPAYYWDFFDTPDEDGARDGAVALVDVLHLVQRFGQTGDPNVDVLTTPVPPPPAYHPAFDRGGQIGPYVWQQAPADGAITLADVLAMFSQFGHACL